jgi:acylpyruvate hydrolase
VPEYPTMFPKFSEALIGAGDPILLPPEASAPDFEAELAFVVGRPVRRAAGREALDAVAGYTAANDVTMRDFQYRTRQWLPGKTWANTTPLGPFLVTADEVGDPHDLDIALELNGERMQSGNTSQFIFDIPTIVATISEFLPLAPGDVVLTGTPSGVGYHRDPKILLKDGDRVAVIIERVGRLENPVAAERVGGDA